jgi:O-antigen/teichoic acid export membrane protein
MGIVIRQSIISTIISYVGVLIGYVSLLYLFPKFMSLEQIGLLRTIQDAAILFSPFAQFGITQSIFRYHPQLAKDHKTSASFISLMLLLSLVGFSLFLIVFKIFEKPALAYFQDNAKEIIQYAYLVIWLTLIMLLTSVLETFSRAVLKTTIPNLLKEVVIRLLLILLAFFYFKGVITFDQFIIGSVLAYLLCLLILLLNLISTGDLKISFGFGELDKPIMKEMFLYGILSFAGMAGMILIGKVDSIMVTALIGTKANAIYTTAFYMATVIEMPKRALSQLAMPLIARAFEKNDLKEIETLYTKTAINQFIIGALLLIGIWINLDTVFYFMPKKEAFEAGRWVVLFIGIGKLVDMLFGPSSEIIVLSKHYKFNIVLIVILAGIVIVSNNTLIPAFGITGAAIGAALALIIFNSVKYIFIYVKFGLQPFTVNTLKVVAIALLTLLLSYLLPKLETPLLDLIFRSSIVTIFFGGAVYFFNASEDGTKIVNAILNKLKLK